MGANNSTGTVRLATRCRSRYNWRCFRRSHRPGSRSLCSRAPRTHIGLGEQPVCLAGHPGKPGHIGLCVVPAHIDDRLSAPPPAGIVSPPFLRAAGDRNAGPQSANVTSYFEIANGLAIVTLCRGPSLPSRPFSPRGDPIMNSPAGTMTISGQSLAHSPERCARLQRPLAIRAENVGPEIRDHIGPHRDEPIHLLFDVCLVDPANKPQNDTYQQPVRVGHARAALFLLPLRGCDRCLMKATSSSLRSSPTCRATLLPGPAFHRARACHHRPDRRTMPRYSAWYAATRTGRPGHG